MKKLFNILLVIFFITLLGSVFMIKKYENIYIKNVADSAIYFQNPSRLLLKVNCIFDEAIMEVHRYQYHKNSLTKLKILLTSAKNLLKNKQEYKKLVNIINSTLLKIDTNQNIDENKVMRDFHKILNKISFSEYQKSILFFEKYKKNINQFQTILYLIILIIVLLSFALLFILYQSTLLRKITYLSETDQLTQAYNRRKFFEEINHYGNDYSIIMFDIDHFKKINDTYGHDKGDFVLKTLIEIIRKNIRKDDMIFRWGGEEFFVLFKHMNLEEAKKMAEKLRNLVANYDFDGIKITISISVVTSKDGEKIEKIIKILDEGLYEAKNSGRNKVIVKGQI